MIQFLLKGLRRDRSRSLFPLLVVAAGVFIVVFMQGWINGAENSILGTNATFFTGHVKVATQAYHKESAIMTNELALTELGHLLQQLESMPMIWTPRIRFGGLIDIADHAGETRSQTPFMCLAVSMAPTSREHQILNLQQSLVRGRLPEAPGEILISEIMANNLQVKPGEMATLIGTTMNGSMSMRNFHIVGAINLGIVALDRNMLIMEFRDAQEFLDMEDAAGEILGFSPDLIFHEEKARLIADQFNQGYDGADEFAPRMVTLPEQNDLETMIKMMGLFSSVAVGIFVFAMSIVLWNAGLIGSLRRYNEFGIRMALGESKGHIYATLLCESAFIGAVGTILGTLLGLSVCYYLQVKGIDISSMMRQSGVVMANVIRAKITPATFVIGFIPGLAATQLGAMFSGLGIFRRQTSELMKELEV
ncbi:MAG: FtsX-like permease family protein [Calditrichaeota bacterium]|nr:MAG: FtsX-like permease family protein [Calditrichota bacterium]